MADTKISALPAATTPLGATDQIPVVQGGETRRVPASALSGGGGAILHPGYVNNHGGLPNWYTGWDANLNNTPIYSSASTCFHLLILPVAATISRLAVSVSTSGAAGTTCRLGIYANSNGKPTTRLVESPAVDVSSTGLKESVLATPLTLQPGTYWLASFAAGYSTQYHGYSYGGGDVYYSLGVYYPNNAYTNGSSIGGLLTSAETMPTTVSASTVSRSNGSGTIPAVFFRVS